MKKRELNQESLAGLYRQLLGLREEREVAKVELKIGEQRVGIELDWAGGNRGKCPECGVGCAIHDRREAREWWHLDTMQFDIARIL